MHQVFCMGDTFRGLGFMLHALNPHPEPIMLGSHSSYNSHISCREPPCMGVHPAFWGLLLRLSTAHLSLKDIHHGR